MSKVEQLESEIAKLPVAEACQVAQWLEEHLAEQWDRQIEEDAKNGQLDKLTQQALEEVEAGETQSLDEFLRNP